MGLLIDIYQILKKEPKALKYIQKETISFIKPRLKFLQKKYTIGQKSKNYQLLINNLTSQNFSENFIEQIDYFGTLLGLIVDLTYIKGKGCLLRNFYSQDILFYFPAPVKEVRLVNEVKLSQVKVYYLKKVSYNKDRFENATYTFYAIKANENTYSELNVILEKSARENKNQENECFEYLRKHNIQTVALNGIEPLSQHRGYKFYSEKWQSEKDIIRLSFRNASSTKKLLAEDLTNLNNFNPL